MRRKKIWLALLATAMVAGSASAAPFVMDIDDFFSHGTGVASVYENWGVNNASSLFNAVTTSTTGAWASTKEGAASWQGDGLWHPGSGQGQDFDIEAMYSGFDADTRTLYVTMVTGFNLRGEIADGFTPEYYFVGDLFIGFGRNPATPSNVDGSWDLGLQISTLSSDAPGLANINWSSPGAYPANSTLTGYINTDADVARTTLDAYGNPLDTLGTLSTSGTPPTPGNGFPVNNPFRIDTGNSGDVGSFEFQYLRGGADSGWTTATQSGTDHNVYNFAYTINNQDWVNLLYDVDGNANPGYSLHWTMSCGNDVANMHVPGIEDGTPPTVPGDPNAVVPVPAAAPMGLLGMVALGLFRKVRAKKS